MFAGVLLLTLGTINVIDGIAAIGRAHFYVGNAHYVFGDLKTWGWVALCLGVLLLLVGFGVFVRTSSPAGRGSSCSASTPSPSC
jgi:uncharacterized membrane protein